MGADVFYQQLLSLGMRGYRLISVGIPAVDSVEKFIKSFWRLLNFLLIESCHLLGSSLGGYLALSFTNKYKERIKSLILTNAFQNTQLFQANASFVPCYAMPQWYLQRYITSALPTSTHSLQIALSTDFVLKQVHNLTRLDLSARLSLNLDRYSVETLEFDQSKVTIIDAIDSSMNEGMRDALYNMLNKSRVSLMKSGGDFPYLSNHQEYTMLIQVHLRRVMNMNNMSNVIKEQDVENNKEVNYQKKKKQKLPDLRGIFDHRRLYHDAHKQSLFKDDNDDEHKDGVILNEYASDSSQSSDMMDMKYPEADIKRKSLMFAQSKSYEDNDDDHIVGIDPPKHPKSEKIEQPNVEETDLYSFDPKQYLITDEKKRMYLMDKRIKKKRYKEYLARKKKAYKKYLAHKKRQNGDDDDNDKIIRHKKKKKKRKKRRVQKQNKKKKMKFSPKRIRPKKQIEREQNEKKEDTKIKSLLSPIIAKQSEVVIDTNIIDISPRDTLSDDDDTPNTMLGMLPIHSIEEESSKLSQIDYFDDDDDDEYKDDIKQNVEEKEDESAIVSVNKERRISRHRALRVKHVGMASDDEENDDLDQSPMDLIVKESQPRPTTIAGHRYIPSYDSTMNVEEESKANSNEYYSWSDNRNRADSFISELGDYDFVESEIQQWPMEGNDDIDMNEPLVYDEENVGDSIF